VVSCVSCTIWRGGWACIGWGRGKSSWWRDICRIRDGVGFEAGIFYEENACRKVGIGTNTLFCSYRWVGRVPLRERFSRLFNLAVDKWVSVADMEALGWGRAVRLGSGGVVCCVGRRNYQRSAR